MQWAKPFSSTVFIKPSSLADQADPRKAACLGDLRSADRPKNPVVTQVAQGRKLPENRRACHL